jgi:endonuclease YncB( thermonuclease family)
MLRATLFAATGLAASAAAYVAQQPAPDEFAYETGAAAFAQAAPPPEPQTVQRKVRDVTPEGITPGPSVTAPLVRLPPPAPPPQPRPEARNERVHKPIVVSAGVIKVGGRDIRLAGIEAPDFRTECGDGADAWPCGRMARAALRRFIRGRAIDCVVPPQVRDIPATTECRVAGESLSEWLVAQGWARAAGGGPYAELEAAARDAGLGIWSRKRPGAQAADSVAISAPASSPDSTLEIRPRISETP